jgi:hypothetical protein
MPLNRAFGPTILRKVLNYPRTESGIGYYLLTNKNDWGIFWKNLNDTVLILLRYTHHAIARWCLLLTECLLLSLAVSGVTKTIVAR